jgi:hypothetical protein
MNRNNDLRSKLQSYESEYDARIWSSISDSLDKIESNRRKSLFTLPLLMVSFLLALLISLSYLYFDLDREIIDNSKAEIVEASIETPFLLAENYFLNTNLEKNNSTTVSDKVKIDNTVSDATTKISKVEATSAWSEKASGYGNEVTNEIFDVEHATILYNSDAEGIVLENHSAVKTDFVEYAKILPTIAFENLASESIIKITGHPYHISNDDCLGFNNEKLRFSVDAYFSNDYGFRNFSPRHENMDSYLNMREETEIPGYSFSAGFRVNMFMASNFGMSTGLNYTQINETFKYVDPESSQIRTITTIDYIFQNGVIIDSIVNTEQIVIPGTSELVHQNRYRMIDIPIIFGYQKDIGKSRWYYSVNAGAFINIIFRQNLKIIDPEIMIPADFGNNSIKNNMFNVRLGTSLFASVGLHYRLSDHFDLTIEPNFRLHSNSLTSGAHPLTQSYLMVGGLTGIRYNF